MCIVNLLWGWGEWGSGHIYVSLVPLHVLSDVKFDVLQDFVIPVRVTVLQELQVISQLTTCSNRDPQRWSSLTLHGRQVTGFLLRLELQSALEAKQKSSIISLTFWLMRSSSSSLMPSFRFIDLTSNRCMNTCLSQWNTSLLATSRCRTKATS